MGPRIASLSLVALLAGCTTVSAPDLTIVCPPAPKPYTQAQEAKAAAELRSLPADSELGAMMADYASDRAASRACKNP